MTTKKRYARTPTSKLSQATPTPSTTAFSTPALGIHELRAARSPAPRHHAAPSPPPFQTSNLRRAAPTPSATAANTPASGMLAARSPVPRRHISISVAPRSIRTAPATPPNTPAPPSLVTPGRPAVSLQPPPIVPPPASELVTLASHAPTGPPHTVPWENFREDFVPLFADDSDDDTPALTFMIPNPHNLQRPALSSEGDFYIVTQGQAVGIFGSW